MPHVCVRDQSSNAHESQVPMYTVNGPMYMIFCPCSCGRGPCVQTVLVSGHQIRALQTDGQDGIIHIPLPVPDRDVPHVLEQYAMPAHVPPGRIVNDSTVPYFVESEPGRFEYPTYPEVQPREYRRRNRTRRRRRNNHSNDYVDSGNESNVDR